MARLRSLLWSATKTARITAREADPGADEVGFTCPPGSVTYWVGEAPGDKVYKDLKAIPKVVAETTAMLASNAAHLARLLNSNTYSGMRAALLAKLTGPASRRASTSRSGRLSARSGVRDNVGSQVRHVTYLGVPCWIQQPNVLTLS